MQWPYFNTTQSPRDLSDLEFQSKLVAAAIISKKKKKKKKKNRLDQIESVVFKLWMLISPTDLFSDYLDITTSVVVPCGGPKNYPRMSIQCCYFYMSWSLGGPDCRVHYLFGNRVAFNLGLGSVRDVASAIISHEQTQSNRDCFFWNFGFPNDLFSDY